MYISYSARTQLYAAGSVAAWRGIRGWIGQLHQAQFPRAVEEAHGRSLPPTSRANLFAAVGTRPRHHLQHLPGVWFQPKLIPPPPSKVVYVTQHPARR